MVKVTRIAYQVAAVVALSSSLLPAQAQSQEGCPPWKGAGSTAENERVISAARDKVATIDFSSVYTGVSVSVEGKLCGPDGQPIPGATVRLVKYSVDPGAVAAGEVPREPSVEDLRIEHPFSVIGERETATGQAGDFEFLAVRPGKLALEVDWREVTGVSHVTWHLTWKPGPVMAVSRGER